MTKKWAVVVVAVGMALAGGRSALAAEGFGAAGCGLGSVIFGSEKGVVQIFAATTNGTFYSQTFGITSGTSNCEKRPKSFSDTRVHEFVAANMDGLAGDIARGTGESLETLAELMAIAPMDRSVVYAKLQSRFGTIFASEQVDAAEVIDSIATVIRG